MDILNRWRIGKCAAACNELNDDDICIVTAIDARTRAREYEYLPMHEQKDAAAAGRDNSAYSLPVPGSPMRVSNRVTSSMPSVPDAGDPVKHKQRGHQQRKVHTCGLSSNLIDYQHEVDLVDTDSFQRVSPGLCLWDEMSCNPRPCSVRKADAVLQSVRKRMDEFRQVQIMCKDGSLVPSTLVVSDDGSLLRIWYDVGTDDIPKMTGRSSGASETDINASDAGGNDVARKQEADSAANGEVELNPCETTYYGAQSGRGTVGRAKLDVLMSGVTDVFVGVLEPTYATLCAPADELCVTMVFDESECATFSFPTLEARDEFAKCMRVIRHYRETS